MEIGGGDKSVWQPKKPTVYRRGDTYKKYLPDYLESIKKHYGSSFASSKRFKELSPFDFHRNSSSGCYKDKDWTPVIAKIAPSVVSVSIFIGVRRKVDCTGLVIRWDEFISKATVLTCAKLLRIPEDEDRDDYYIVVRLPNGNILLAEEHYVDYYHNIMTLKVSSDSEMKPVKLISHQIVEGTEVVALSRDFYSCSLSKSSGVVNMDYPYFGAEELLSSTCSGSQDGDGGPLITRTGHVCGINFFDGYKNFHPLPTSVVCSCLKKWKSKGIVVQPWFGFSVLDIADLPYEAMEAIANVRLDVTTSTDALTTPTGVVTNQVHEGSPADEAGVRSGDIVIELRVAETVHISSISEYSRTLRLISDMLSDTCTRETLASAPNVAAKVCDGVSGYPKLVWAKNLTVDDRRFCCSWPGDEYEMFRSKSPLFGSQTDYAFSIGFNDKLSA